LPTILGCNAAQSTVHQTVLTAGSLV